MSLSTHAARAEQDRLEHLLRTERRGQDDHSRPDLHPAELPQHREAVLLRHLQVDHQHVRPVAGDRGERRLAVGAGGEHREVRLARQKLLHACENDPVVIGQHQRDRHSSSPAGHAGHGRRQRLERQLDLQARARPVGFDDQAAGLRSDPLHQRAGALLYPVQRRQIVASAEREAAALVGDLPIAGLGSFSDHGGFTGTRRL
ncbi:MAG TPA: hypothetical protein VLE23_15645 [Geminicoccaceae bacterium]|nr:hypothetical protein [Geminicoccaceae bacterium]